MRSPKNKVSLAINISDVLNSRKYQSTAKTETFINESEFQ